MNCIICMKQATTVCDNLKLCLSHHLEKSEDTHHFITRYGLQAIMVKNGYIFDIYLRAWVRSDEVGAQ